MASIPFGKNRPLYSQKDFFKAEGRLVINGEEMLTDEDSTAIVDDHRGFYPRRAHYDWVTTMGKCNVDGFYLFQTICSYWAITTGCFSRSAKL